ncbi:MAG: hypothetical protein ACR2Q4_05365, partial [Geminicoccaceae bacterium]
MRLPIRARLTLIFAGLMLLVLAGSGLLLYVGFAAQLDTAIQEDLDILAKDLVADINDGDIDILKDFGQVEPEELFAQILNPDGRILESSHNITEPLITVKASEQSTSPRIFEGTVATGRVAKPLPARFLVMPIIDGPTVIVGA